MHTLHLKTKDDNERCISNAIRTPKVKICVGTDYVGWPEIEQNACELECLVELGMSPMRAIKAATSQAAEMLEKSDDIGAVKSGLLADLIAVDKDPSQDITELQRVKFVMLGGKVIKQ